MQREKWTSTTGNKNINENLFERYTSETLRIACFAMILTIIWSLKYLAAVKESKPIYCQNCRNTGVAVELWYSWEREAQVWPLINVLFLDELPL